MNAKARKNTGDADWDNRVLCSDGNCIGVIGNDGRCKECGKPYEGDLPFSIDDSQADEQTPAEVIEDGPEHQAQSGSTETDAASTDSDDDSDWDNRKLCSDGNCIGVIGADGCCKECGKPYEGDPE